MQSQPKECPNTYWHQNSFNRFLTEYLPCLLAERLPLSAYHADYTDTYDCCVQISVAGPDADVTTVFTLPYPDASGCFQYNARAYVVIPQASSPRLDEAVIACVGEQLLQYIQARLGKAPDHLPWDTALLLTWCPLDTWTNEFLAQFGQPLDNTNWIATQTHLRRIQIAAPINAANTVSEGHPGRVCPIDTPEDAACGRVVTIALGAAIEGTRLVVKNSQPESSLGVAASMIPFLEHDDPARALIGTTLMRQMHKVANPEPALVQTGNEPADSEFWTGRNLLTAFVSWGEATYGDGIVISESAAARLGGDRPLAIGDRLANRHGSKGVVSRILPDCEMPHLADGTSVDLVFSFIGLHTRLNHGQQMEALAGRIAHATGTPKIVPPFAAPDAHALSAELRQLGLPADGMEQLYLGYEGPALAHRSLVGWVYWGVTQHLAADKMHVFTSGQRGQMMGSMEYDMLRSIGAYEFIAEQLNTRSTQHPEANTLAKRLAAGPVVPAKPPTPAFSELLKRLAAAGIQVGLQGANLAFSLAPPTDPIPLVSPVPHPWLPNQQLQEIGILSGLAEYEQLIQINARIKRLIDSHAPQALLHQAQHELAAMVHSIYTALVQPEHLQLRGRALFSGRAVITPGIGLTPDQVGIPEEMAWALFGPWTKQALVSAGVKNADEAVTTKSVQAQAALDSVMAQAWVVINRAPTLAPTAILAFHPVRQGGVTISLPPMVCDWLNADFDGDQVAIFLPVTTAGQREAAELLSVVGHLERDHTLIDGLLPTNEALWGMAWSSLTPSGYKELCNILGEDITLPGGYLNRTVLAAACRNVLKQKGVTAAVTMLYQLWRYGFAQAKASGASLSPLGMGVQAIRNIDRAQIQADTRSRPDPEHKHNTPVGEAIIHTELVSAQLAANNDFANDHLGPQLLAVKSGARGRLNQLTLLVGGGREVTSPTGTVVPVLHGYQTGLEYSEWIATAAATWRHFVEMTEAWEREIQAAHEKKAYAEDFGVLARARRAAHPGVVFAQAAAGGLIEPQIDIDSRLFIGLPVN